MSKKVVFVLVCLLIVFGITHHAKSQYFKPINFHKHSKIQRNAQPEHYCLAVDKYNQLFAGTANGINHFDGNKWEFLPVVNGSWVTALEFYNDTCYIGLNNDFGILEFTKNGEVEFKSLTDSIANNILHIINISKVKNKICFQTNDFLYVLNGENITKVRAFTSFQKGYQVNNRYYVRQRDLGLFEIKLNEVPQIEPVLKGELFEYYGIAEILEFNNKQLIITEDASVYDLNNLTNLPLYTLALPKTYGALITNNSELVCYSLSSGIAIKSLISENKKQDVNIESKRIFSIAEDKQGNIWTAGNQGISCINNTLPFEFFTKNNGLEGNVRKIGFSDDQIIAGTDQGIFIHKYKSENSFSKISHLAVNDFCITENGSYIATDDGIEKIEKNKLLSISDIGAKVIKYNRKNNLLFIGNSNGITAIELNKKTSYIAFEVPEIKNIESIEFDTSVNDKTSLIIGTYGNKKYNLYRLNIDIKTQNYESYPLDSVSNWNYCFSSPNGILVANKKGLFTIKNNAIQETNLLGITFKKPVYQLNYSDGNYFVSEDNLISHISDSVYNDSLFAYLDFGKINKLSQHNKKLWAACDEGLVSYNITSDYNNIKLTKPILKRIKLNDTLQIYPLWENNNNAIQTFPAKTADIEFELIAPFYIKQENIQYSYSLKGLNKDWSSWSSNPVVLFNNLKPGTYEFKFRVKNVFNTVSSTGTYAFEILKPWYLSTLAIIIWILAILVLIIYIVRAIIKYRLKQLTIQNEKLEQEVQLRTEKIRVQNIELKEQKDDIEKKNVALHEQKEEILKQKEEITSSITYAKRIQNAIVPSERLAECLLKDYFLLWKPHTIVSGDFWWLGEKNDYIVATAADCTGHGVPGAFMSMLGVSFLNEIVNQQSITESHEILNRLRKKVKVTLGQTEEESTSKDGMDIALLVIDPKNMKAQFSGAYNPLYLYRNGELIETKATRNPIGVYIKEKPFEQHVFDLEKGDTMYMFSDGFPDQFGGEKEKKYSSKRFKQLLLEIHTKPMAEQKEILNQEFENWRGDIEQIDDVIILGIRM